MRTLRWKIAATATAVVLGIGGAVAATGVAAADPGTMTSKSFVDGLDKVTDDFGDHAAELGAPLSNRGPNSWGTDIVVVWQSILAADGYMSFEGIDGYFGKMTADATARWQADRGLDADKPGTVGHTTWAYADNSLIADDGTVDYRTPGLGVVVFKRAPGPDGHYTLVSTADAADGYGWRNRGGDHIYFSKMTLRLALE